MTGKIAVIGSAETVTAFMAIGADVYDAADSYAAADELRKLVKSDDYAVIFITEDLAAPNAALMEKLKSRVRPSVIPIPGIKTNGFAMAGIRKDVERAIGADILFNDDKR